MHRRRDVFRPVYQGLIMFMDRSVDSDGSPLAVCINDCELDHGQSPRELVALCFRVHCAFAQMRWCDFLEKNADVKADLQDPGANASRLSGAA
jgi:hypothetical protein